MVGKISQSPGPGWYPVDLVINTIGGWLNYTPPHYQRYVIIDACARGGNGGNALSNTSGGGGGGAGASIVGYPIVLSESDRTIAFIESTAFYRHVSINWTDNYNSSRTIELVAGSAGSNGTSTSGGAGGRSGIGYVGGAGGTSSTPAEIGYAGSGNIDGGLCVSGDGGSYTYVLSGTPYASNVCRVLDVNESAASPIGRYVLAGSTLGGPPLSLWYQREGGRGGASIFGPGGHIDYANPAWGAGGGGGGVPGGGGSTPPQPGGPPAMRVWIREI